MACQGHQKSNAWKNERVLKQALARRWILDARFDVVLFPYEERNSITGELITRRVFDANDVGADARSYAIREQINPFCGLYRREAYLQAGGYDEDHLCFTTKMLRCISNLLLPGLSLAAESQIAIINHRRLDSMSASNRLKCLQAQY
jgi:hypothetical protein